MPDQPILAGRLLRRSFVPSSDMARSARERMSLGRPPRLLRAREQMTGLFTIRGWRACGLTFPPLLAGGCGSTEHTSEFDPVYYAVSYGVVRQAGNPVGGVEVEGEVYLGVCPPSGPPASGTATRSGVGGTYRLLLASSTPAAGQCVSLTAAGATGPVFQTLTGTPFSATSPAEVRDSVKIDLVLP